MRKQTKIAALVSAAALLTIGASMTSFAAGWTYDEGAGYWVYKDNDGYNVEYEWRKWTDGQWCYLGEGGKCVADELVEYNSNLYYLDVNGFRVLNDWHYEENVDGEMVGDTTPAGFWYYLGSNGQAWKNKADKIGDHYYRFGDDGRMLAGWVDVSTDNGIDTYFYNDTVEETNSAYGEALTGWQYMQSRNAVVDDQDVSDHWFYFTDKGLMYTGDKYFGRKWWHFDDTGELQTGWQSTSTPSVASGGDYAYYDEDSAKLRSGWIYETDKTVNGKTDGTGTYWFYVNSYGTPVKAYEGTGTAVGSDGKPKNVAAIRVGGKTYLLDSVGRMLDGVLTLSDVYVIQGGQGKLTNGTYYFNSDDNASGGKKGDMVLNTKKTVYDDYDNATEYYFSKNGTAYKDAIAGNCYYDGNGEKVVAEYDTYTVYTVAAKTAVSNTVSIAAGRQIVIRENGTVARNTIVSHVDGYKRYYVGKLPSASEKAKYTFIYAPGYDENSTEVANAYEATCYRVEE